MHTLTRAIDLTCDTRTGGVIPGQPPVLDLAAHPVRLWVTLEGAPHVDTGLLVDVARIDRALAGALADLDRPLPGADALLDFAAAVFLRSFPEYALRRLALDLTPRLQLAHSRWEETPMIEITRSYDFAAGHRLGNPHWSDEQNRQAFGKCANPHGHGHNYTVQVTIRARPDQIGHALQLDRLDDAVREFILDRFDHKNLNADTAEFASLNPTVENMAVVFFDLLDGRFAPAVLHRVRVWESPKTFADYYGPQAGPLRYSHAI